ncbi:MAG: hypothetical protein GY861_05365 [bacterium]|nr:hypothetical protein [bacterium]
MKELLKVIDEYRKYYNIVIQMYNRDVNIYVNRPDDDSELFSIGGYSEIRDALKEAVDMLKRICPL